MKLLLDQNISFKLVARPIDLFPGSAHVRDLGMADAEDGVIWDYARAGEFTIVSKDGDFHQRSLVLGAPPKVVWLRVGNAPTGLIAGLIRSRYDQIEEFIVGDATLLVLDQ